MREIVAWAADWHEDVERKVRLRAVRVSGDLRALRAVVDRGLRTRRFLDWRASREWARDATPIVAELEAAAEQMPSRSASSSTYAQLKAAADLLDAWAVERDAALGPLRRRDPSELVDALLAEGDSDLAWRTAIAAESDPGLRRWLRLAEARPGLASEDLADPDARAVAIRAEHPELAQALTDGRDHVSVGGSDVNIRLHLAMHEIVASQLADDDPPEVNETAQRLLAAGYDRHEVLHMLAGAMSGQIHAALTAAAPYDHAQHVAALRALPASWERDRAKRQLKTGARRRARAGRSTKRRRR